MRSYIAAFSLYKLNLPYASLPVNIALSTCNARYLCTYKPVNKVNPRNCQVCGPCTPVDKVDPRTCQVCGPCKPVDIADPRNCQLCWPCRHSRPQELSMKVDPVNITDHETVNYVDLVDIADPRNFQLCWPCQSDGKQDVHNSHDFISSILFESRRFI